MHKLKQKVTRARIPLYWALEGAQDPNCPAQISSTQRYGQSEETAEVPTKRVRTPLLRSAPWYSFLSLPSYTLSLCDSRGAGLPLPRPPGMGTGPRFRQLAESLPISPEWLQVSWTGTPQGWVSAGTTGIFLPGWPMARASSWSCQLCSGESSREWHVHRESHETGKRRHSWHHVWAPRPSLPGSSAVL